MLDNFHQNVHHSFPFPPHCALNRPPVLNCVPLPQTDSMKNWCVERPTRERAEAEAVKREYVCSIWDSASSANWQLRNHRRVRIIIIKEEAEGKGNEREKAIGENILRNCKETTTWQWRWDWDSKRNDNDSRNDDEGEREVLCTTRYESTVEHRESDHNSQCRLSILLIYFRKDKNHEQFPSSLFSPSFSAPPFPIQCRLSSCASCRFMSECARRGSEPSWRGSCWLCVGDGRESSMNKSLNIKISFFSFERIEIFCFYGRWLYDEWSVYIWELRYLKCVHCRRDNDYENLPHSSK